MPTTEFALGELPPRYGSECRYFSFSSISYWKLDFNWDVNPIHVLLPHELDIPVKGRLHLPFCTLRLTSWSVCY